MSVTVEFDRARVAQELKSRIDKVQPILDARVLADSNYYCPEDTSNLIKSGIFGTKIGSGHVIWDSPYAKSQYYDHPHKSHQKNPNACMKWFEAAKAKCYKLWGAILNDGYKKAGM